MYTSEKSYGVENYINNSRIRNKNMPSFSSSLLDEIYRSIDGNAQKTAKRQGDKKSIEDEEMASFRKSYMVQKWMENEVSDNVVSVVSKRRSSLQDRDLLFFSSTPSSSNSSSVQLSSSDTELFGSGTKRTHQVSRPKPVRTSVSPRENEKKKDCSYFDDYKNHQKTKMGGDNLIKSKSRALKIYANLKKVKQPISPGGKLTSFINSLFNNANGKNSEIQEKKSSKSSSTCSSTSSFSRSCLSKSSTESREKMRNGTQRSVRFHPVSVIVDEDADRYGLRSIPTKALPNWKEKNRVIQENAENVLKGYCHKRRDELSMFKNIFNENYEEEDHDDAMSDSSSDLFELDHLTFLGSNRFCEELPVYETTQFDPNRRIASRLIC